MTPIGAGEAVLRVGGLSGGSEAWWLIRNLPALGKTLAVARTDEEAQNLADNINALSRKEGLAAYFSEEEEDVRIAALSRWVLEDSMILTSSLSAAQSAISDPKSFRQAHRRLQLGERSDRSSFLSHAVAHGYGRVDTVEEPGEIAVRGEVLDIWSPGWDSAVRVLWPYDAIDSLRKIDPITQRSTDALDFVLVRPAKLSLASGPSVLTDHLPREGALFESRLMGGGEGLSWPGRRVRKAALGEPADREERYEAPPAFAGAPVSFFAAEMRKWLRDGWRISIWCRNAGEQERLEEILLAEDRSFLGDFEARRIDLPLGGLNHGFLNPDEKTAVLSNAQIFGRTGRVLRLPKFTGGKSLSRIGELKAGDYVVHERFGLGRYRHLSHVAAGGSEADYLTLEYKGGDRVLVPLFEFGQVQKYMGAGGKKPQLSSLDTAGWERTKEKVKEEVALLAKALLERAAKRAALAGTMFPPDSHMEKEFGDSFLYELTPDQARAIRDVKNDMMSLQPMDRVVCGDVGYGKTEVALRAAMKAVTAGRQVAVLVPTTILAEQHGRNFTNRFAGYPVSVAVLSRFAKPEDKKKIVQDLRRGVIDIVIGTHRLLSPDITFKNLGLIIIDEEHRFGVKQKDKLMGFRDVVDVLTLSATPIPRTLGAALGGLKQLSLIETPPEGRLPIATHVGPFDEKMISSAITNEIRRGGQVFYVHNRVSTIARRQDWLERLLSGSGLSARIGHAHGKMSGAELEKIMWDFLHRKYDILLSTSIIESGLDIPSVNTLIVEEAEDFGLSQLYQLKGRVGRERQKAYCYLFHSPGALTEEAEKRLEALKEFASLGAGFKLALRDLEIRGAGNLLGPEQHGFMNAVGVDLYGRLLSDEIERQKSGSPAGAAAEPAEDVSLEIPVSAYLPGTYMASESERISFYRRLLDAKLPELPALREELVDRFGKLPPPAEELFQVAELREQAKRKGAMKIALVRDGLEIHFKKDTVFSKATMDRLLKEGGAASFLSGERPGLKLDPPSGAPLSAWIKNFLSSLE